MSTYDQKQAARRARLEARAELARQKAQALHEQALGMADAIPVGQPILAGHHSEGRDRRYRDRITNTFRKAHEQHEAAQHFERRAAAVGLSRISSDDPDAIEKLRAELADIEATRTRMKQINKVIRTHASPEARHAALIAIGFTAAQAEDLIKPDLTGRLGFPKYMICNNRASGRRIQTRIAELETRRAQADREIVADGYVYREDPTENRILFIFPGKPDEMTRAILKSRAFRWSPSRGAWVRFLNNAGLYAAEMVRADLLAA